MTETKTFKGILEAVIPAKTGKGKPYLKIMAIPEGEDKSRTYNYHAPWEFKNATEDEIAEHIKKTLIGLVALTGMDISFTYVVNPNRDPQKKPFKNIKEFPAEFKAAGEKKELKQYDETPVTSHQEGGKGPEATDPETEKEIAEAHKTEKYRHMIEQGRAGFKLAEAVFKNCTGKKVVWYEMTEAEKEGLMAWATDYKRDVAKGRGS